MKEHSLVTMKKVEEENTILHTCVLELWGCEYDTEHMGGGETSTYNLFIYRGEGVDGS